MNKEKGFTLIELIIVITILFIVITLLLLTGIGGTTGSHIGYVTAVEDTNNLIFDSRLVYVKTELESSQEDKYCFNPDIRADLDRAAKEKKNVKLNFHNDYLVFAWDCVGGISIIESIEDIGIALNNMDLQDIKYPADELFEELARIEHERWSDWQKYYHSRCVKVIDVDDKTKEEVLREVTIPIDVFERAERQINTPYHELSEEEKNSDRNQVLRYWHLFK